MKKIPTLIIALALASCGGGGGGGGGDGGGSSSGGSSGGGGAVTPPPATTLVVNSNYTGTSGASTMLDFTMPIDGIVDFSLKGTEVTIYDQSLSPLFETSGDIRDTQFPLTAGTYKLKFYFWSANSRHGAAYSPALLSPLNLPILQNNTYSSTTSRSDYFLLRMQADGNIDFSGLGTNVSIYDLSMSKTHNNIENTGPVSLLAGNYEPPRVSRRLGGLSQAACGSCA